MWYVYVLQSQKNKNWFYKGSTNNLRKRFSDHQKGKEKSTKPYRPFKLVYYEAYLTEKAVREREVSIKKSGSVWIPIKKRIIKSLKD
ncbi:GIY-YIG nuclease family protein [Patescibacteria group bacterium]|nr:GIY-YIG nuclease family protein [Patescibacteria group bacterium]